ncbi:hypothetical protein R3P38DRAFT_3172850 [Favolaschia claudopus]|uniref:RING-type domain-containing protein n=1 Tax=Favolaschia claudopus TaxID=2862362 RepID=A0AAW0DNM0_9AGAR
MIRTPLRRSSSGTLGSIPEESNALNGNAVEYLLDLGSGSSVSQSRCPSPAPQIKRPVPRRPVRKGSGANLRKEKEPERDCGICFELATNPVRTRCCGHLFCAEHIFAWLDGPSSDGLCPSCGAPPQEQDLLALGHPSLLFTYRPAPPAPPPTRASSPVLSTSDSAAPYAAYPLAPVQQDPSSSSSEGEEDEDATDYSLPALVYARAMQTRRHMPHPFSSVVGVKAALGRVGRVAIWVMFVALLAARGRWTTE